MKTRWMAIPNPPAVKYGSRIGLVVESTESGRRVLVQFGTDGPFEKVWNSKLEYVSQDEFHKWLAVSCGCSP